MPWRELERRLSWRTGAARTADQGHGDAGADGAVGTARPVLAARAVRPARRRRARVSAPWAELHCHSSYSFLDGASSP
jgi:error-prone DNA polymerase